jgi:tRNA nucleotidyltransferase (CCA-adding enzyme)
MPRVTSLAKKIETGLPAGLVNFLWLAGEIAHTRGERLYLVGGVVRDLILGQTTLDLDLVVEGNGIELARRLQEINHGELAVHPRFISATLKWERWSIDVATARTETYARPAALPDISPSTINQDLFRRDFSINAMAVQLNPGEYGKLLDPHDGRSDLREKLVRVLHQKSFIDDPTRIWRGLRYEQRLDFRLEKETLYLLKRDVNMLDSLTSDRIRYEIECVLKEPAPEKVFRRAAELGVLGRLLPSLPGDGWLAEQYGKLREMKLPPPQEMDFRLALLAYPLSAAEVDVFIDRLNLPKSLEALVRDTIAVKNKLKLLATPGVSRSSIFNILDGLSGDAITLNSMVTESPIAAQSIKLYLVTLQNVKVLMHGNDLISMGVPQGPRVKEVLDQLLRARLNGKVRTREDEEKLARKLLDEG